MVSAIVMLSPFTRTVDVCVVDECSWMLNQSIQQYLWVYMCKPACVVIWSLSNAEELATVVILVMLL